MAIIFEHVEVVVLNETQETSFVNFVTSVWPGTPGNIEGASLRKQIVDGDVTTWFTVRGKMVASTPAELPAPPFYLTSMDGDYKYDHIEEVQLAPSQLSAFATFLSQTWSGAVGDVTAVSFTRVDGGGAGVDIQAMITGTKSVATIGELPGPPLKIVAIT